MPSHVLADLVALLHFGFVLFVVFGGLLVYRLNRWAWIHIPCTLWAALISFFNWTCPLTPLENWFRRRGGAPGYQSSFVEHYILPLLYPAPLTRGLQIVIGFFVLGLNLGIYFWIYKAKIKPR